MSIQDALLAAIEEFEDPALVCDLSGLVIGMNDAALSQGVVSSPDVHDMHDILVGGQATWVAINRAADGELLVVPCTTAVLCAWRVTRRSTDASELLLLIAECTGPASQAYADSQNGRSKSAGFTRKKKTAVVESDDDVADSTIGVTYDDLLQKTSRVVVRARSHSGSIAKAGHLTKIASRLIAPHDLPNDSLASAASAPTPPPTQQSPEPSASPALSGSGYSRSGSQGANRTASRTNSQDLAPYVRSRNWLDRFRRSPKTSGALQVDFSRDDINVCQVLYMGPSATIVRASIGGVDVAVKTVPTRYLSANARTEIADVVGVVATLQHPNLLRQLGYNLESTTELVTFFELCETTLSKLWASSSAHTEPTAVLKQAHQVALALEYLHARSLMHRDVKASNVLVRHFVRDVMTGVSETVMKLADFGELAVVMPGAVYRTNVGTPEFMAPEVVAVDATVTTRVYDEQCDMWSFGMLIFEALTGGRVPYADVNHWELASVIAAGTRPTLAVSSPNNAISRALKQIFVDCTTLKPSERATAPAVVDRLDQLLVAVVSH